MSQEENVQELQEPQEPQEATPEPGAGISDEEALAAMEAVRKGEAPTRDATGRFVRREEESEEEPTEDEPSSDDAPNPAREQAVQDIRRVLDLPESILEGMTDEALESVAERARAQKAELDRQYAQAKEADAAPAASEEASSDQQEAPASGQPSLDVDALLQPLELELGEEAAGSVRTLVSGLAQQVSEATEYIRALQGQQQARDERDARERVGERFPDVLDEERYSGAVVPKMQTLLKTGDYTGDGAMQRLIEDACRLVGMTSIAADTSSASSRREQPARRKAGQHPTNGRVAERGLTDEERMAGVIRHARSGNKRGVDEMGWR